jgi:hypothetical protein
MRIRQTSLKRRAEPAFHNGSARTVSDPWNGCVATTPDTSGPEWDKDKPVRMLQQQLRGPFAIKGGLDTLRTLFFTGYPGKQLNSLTELMAL